MKNLLKMFILTCMLGMVWSCEYDDNDLWNKVEEIDQRVESLEKTVAKMNEDISSIQTIVDALNKGKVITNVEQLEDGYKLTFSDNSSVTLKNGENGENAPIIGVKVDEDGIYYWTQTINNLTNWILDDNGDNIPVTGSNGAAGVTPILGVDSEGYWTVDTGDGPSHILDSYGNRIKATGEKGDSFFSSVEETDTAVIITQSNGTVITIEKNAPLSVSFVDGDNRTIKVGTTAEFSLTSVNLDYCKVLEVTKGWNAELSYTQVRAISDVKIAITAPTTVTDANRNCEIRILVSDEAGNTRISKLHISCSDFELRTLTFEDNDFKANTYTLDYSNTTISKWSDLIDNPQYGGAMLYGDYSTAKYYWYDEGNTGLMHTVPYNYDAYCYWGGGHAISNYNTKNYSSYGDFNYQLTVYNDVASDEMNTTGGGHNGSNNFAIHFGYKDGSPWNGTEFLPAINFADGVARTIDHMYVNNSTYAINCYCNGNGLTAQIGPDDWVKLIAIGYDADAQKTGECEIYMCNGPDNIVSEWTKWDLSSLGNVVSIEFNVSGSSDNGYGFSQPAYFAYDDVCVRF